jgi:hypothetical protein
MSSLEQALQETWLKHGDMADLPPEKRGLFLGTGGKEKRMSLLTKPNELTMKETYAGLIYGQPGAGKQNPVTTPVLTPDGWVTMGDLKVGDFVIGLDGKPTKVLGVFPQGVLKTFILKTNDGAVAYSGPEHLWTVRRSTGNSRKSGYQTYTLQELIDKGITVQTPSRGKTGRKPLANWELPLVSPVQFAPKEYLISPYMLGVLIGDGALSSGKVFFSNPLTDSAIKDRVEKLLVPGYSLSGRDTGGCYQYHIIGGNGKNLYNAEIKRLGLNVLSGAKFIPAEYMFGSVEQRLDLLRGLMDTDGSCSGNRTSYSTSSVRLTHDIVSLVQSLGGLAVIHTYQRTDSADEHQVRININLCPFFLRRKADEWKPSKFGRYISCVEQVKDSECVCIKVANEDGLYVINDFIVTHNSTLALSSVNPVCIDVDRGMYRVEKRYQAPSLQVESYQQVLDFLNSDELDGFNTIVIDTLGKLVDCMGEYVAKNNPKYRQSNGQLTQQGWGQIKIEFRALIKLINGKNKSVIFVAHESEEKEGDVTKKRPDVSGSTRKDIVKELDFMGYMEMSGNKRTISFTPSGAYYAKNSMGLDSVIEVPGIQAANSFIRDVVVSAIKARREQDEAQAGPYDELLKTIDGIVSGAQDIEALNEAYRKLSALETVWDSKLYAKSKISEAAKALNAKWDKPANRFVVAAAPTAEDETPAEAPPPPLAETAPSAVASSANPSSNADKDRLVMLRTELGRKLGAIMTEQTPDCLDFFTDEERALVKTLLAKAGPYPQGIALVEGMIKKWEEELESRKAAYVPVPFGDPQEDLPDDGFVDDLPWEKAAQ